MSRQRTITLMDRAPVRIVEEDWPVIARADWILADGKVLSPIVLEDGAYVARVMRDARECFRAQLIVRQNADVRTLVYGTFTHTRRHQPLGSPFQVDGRARAGELVESIGGREVASAVITTAKELHLRAGRQKFVVEHLLDWDDLAAECIGALPAVAI